MSNEIHFNTALNLYQRNGLEKVFWTQLAWHFSYAYVFSTPDYFVQFHPWEHDREHAADGDAPVPLADADCWYMQVVAGDLRKFVLAVESNPDIPRLPFVASHRMRTIAGRASFHTRCWPYDLFLQHLKLHLPK